MLDKAAIALLQTHPEPVPKLVTFGTPPPHIRNTLRFSPEHTSFYSSGVAASHFGMISSVGILFTSELLGIHLVA